MDLVFNGQELVLEQQVCGGNASYAVEGRNFHGPQRKAAWLFFIVFIALSGFPHRVVFSDPMEGISSRLHLAPVYRLHQSLPDHLDSLHGYTTLILYWRGKFSLNCAICLYCIASTLFPLSAAFGCIMPRPPGWYFIELCHASCVYALQRNNYFLLGSNAVLSHESRNS